MSVARRRAGEDGGLTISDLPGDLVFINYATPDGHGSEPRPFAEHAYAEVAAFLENQRGLLLSERVFGEAGVAQQVLAARQALLAPAASRAARTPTFIDGRPCRGGGIAGLQAIAVRSVDDPGAGPLVEGKDAVYLALSDVGQRVRTSVPLPPAQEARLVLEAAEQALASCGWSFGNVRRTWFYLHHILEWYGEFNQVRNDAFRRMGLIGGASLPSIPASTGIEGANAAGGACALDLLATAPRGDRRHEFRRLAHAKQNEATEYGSAFARGALLRLEQAAYVFVSGTASIDGHGKTAYVGDVEAQTRCALEAVKSVLAAGGASAADVCQGTAFLKRADDIDVYLRVARELGFANLPIVCMVADVCRDDLLFELDAAAILR